MKGHTSMHTHQLGHGRMDLCSGASQPPLKHAITLTKPCLVALLLCAFVRFTLRAPCGNVWKRKAQRVLEVIVAKLELLHVAPVAFAPCFDDLQGTRAQIDGGVRGGGEGGALSEPKGEFQKPHDVRGCADPKRLWVQQSIHCCGNMQAHMMLNVVGTRALERVKTSLMTSSASRRDCA